MKQRYPDVGYWLLNIDVFLFENQQSYTFYYMYFGKLEENFIASKIVKIVLTVDFFLNVYNYSSARDFISNQSKIQTEKNVRTLT